MLRTVTIFEKYLGECRECIEELKQSLIDLNRNSSCIGPTLLQPFLKKQYQKLAILLYPNKNKLLVSEVVFFKLIGETNRILPDSRNGNSNKRNDDNGMVSGASIIGGIHKAMFDKDFSSLGTELDIGRVPSSGLSMVVQSLPIGNSSLIGGKGWTSALAEVSMMVGSNSIGSSSVQQTVVSALASGLPNTTAGLNTAEALAQAPSRARTTPQLSVNTQRLEELAIKQPRQLIPVTPSMPKPSVLNSSDKSKPKTVVRTGDMTAASKTGQQQPSSSHLANHSLRGYVRSDPPATSHGKFLVLKPARGNGASPTSRDVSSPTNNASSRVASIQLGVAHSVASAPSISPNHPKLSTMERKAAALSLNSGPTAEKRPSFSQAQSRHDFFNLMRKKTSVNSSAVLPDSGPAISSSNTESEVSSAPVKSHAIENGGQVTGNGGNTCEEVESPAVGEKHLGTNASICPDEEEAAFLRSLGWEESAGDDEGLTEEEINAFYQEVMTLCAVVYLYWDDCSKACIVQILPGEDLLHIDLW